MVDIKDLIISTLITKGLEKLFNVKLNIKNKFKKREKLKTKIYEYLKENTVKTSTKEIKENLPIAKKFNIEEIFNVLKELESEGKIRYIKVDGRTIENTMWLCTMK